MKYLLFFAALIATANALNCQCSKCTGGTCTVETGKCYSIDMEITTGKDKPLKTTIRGCQGDKVDPDICKQGFIIMSSKDEFNLMSNITCCDKDLCNKDAVTNLNKTAPDSNLVCPACFALDKKTCDGKTMYCNKLQKKCFNINGTVTKDTAKAQEFVAKGCAVENTIFKTNATLTFDGVSYTLTDVQFQDAKDGASQISTCFSFVILLPSVLWFLLDSSSY